MPKDVTLKIRLTPSELDGLRRHATAEATTLSALVRAGVGAVIHRKPVLTSQDLDAPRGAARGSAPGWAEDRGQQRLWREEVELTGSFHQALRTHPVPISETAIRMTSNQSLVIDIYIWLAYRLHAVKKPGPCRGSP